MSSTDTQGDENPVFQVWRDRSYDQRAKAIIAFNTCTGDLDDKLEAAWLATITTHGLRTAPVPAEPVAAYERALDLRINQGWRLDGGACPILCTDEINGQQVCRNDLWIATTAALKGSKPAAITQALGSAAPKSDAQVEAVAWIWHGPYGNKSLRWCQPSHWKNVVSVQPLFLAAPSFAAKGDGS